MIAMVQFSPNAARFRSPYNGDVFSFESRWNQAGGYWEATIESDRFGLLCESLPIVAGTDMLAPFASSGIDAIMLAISDRDALADIGKDDLATIANVYLMTQADLS